MRKRNLLYFDDEEKYLDALGRAHNNYEITYKNDIKKLLEELKRREGTKEWPDILLLDVYWPDDYVEASRVNSIRENVDLILKTEVNPAINKLNDEYTKAFTPIGVEWLEEIRKKYGPVSMAVKNSPFSAG